MTAPKNYYGLPVTLSLISKNKFSGGIFDSLKNLTINTTYNSFNDGNYLYIPVLNVPTVVSGKSIQWAIVKIRLSDLSIQIFLSYNCTFPFTNGQFYTGLNSIIRVEESFYFSCPSVAGWGDLQAMPPFIVSTRIDFVPNQIIRMNTNFINDANVYPCIGAEASYGTGILSNGLDCLEITSSEFTNMYTRRFLLNEPTAVTISHGISGLRGSASTYLPDYFNVPLSNAVWGLVNLNSNLIWQNGKFELCGQIKGTNNTLVNFGVPIINATPSDCVLHTFSSVNVPFQNAFYQFNGQWPLTDAPVVMFGAIPDLGMRGSVCSAGRYNNEQCIFVCKNNLVIPIIVNDLDQPFHVALTKNGLVVVGYSNVMLYNLPTLDFDLYDYFPLANEKNGVALNNLSRPVSPLGAFRT